jgi:hypothetical protein
MHKPSRIALLVGSLVAGPALAQGADPIAGFRSSLVAVPDVTRPVGGTIYTPAYATIRLGTGRAGVRLAATLSIHNPSETLPVVLERVDYFDTAGTLVQAFLSGPIAVKPFATVEFFIPEDDVRGGSGANFLVRWSAQAPIAEPMVEAIMIGAIGNASYSFVSQGRAIRIVTAPGAVKTRPRPRRAPGLPGPARAARRDRAPAPRRWRAAPPP